MQQRKGRIEGEERYEMKSKSGGEIKRQKATEKETSTSVSGYSWETKKRERERE